MDQIGALTGPLIVAGVIASMNSYRTGFAVLLAPALAALAVLAVARARYPAPQALGPKAVLSPGGRLSRSFWTYVAACGLIAAGYADFPLIAFHLKRAGVASDARIPLLYAVAMGVDAVAALAFGRLYDRWGKRVLIGAPLFAAWAVPLVFLGDFRAALVGMVLWGVGMGVQESVLRAAVADMAPPGRRGSAYGIFNGAYGLCWFAGSALMGLLYESSPLRLVLLSVSFQAAALAPLLLACARKPEST
jgi:MFS family permease